MLQEKKRALVYTTNAVFLSAKELLDAKAPNYQSETGKSKAIATKPRLQPALLRLQPPSLD